jgi:acyl-coenzyme A synthetase/AMP-(fatty) acid ligase
MAGLIETLLTADAAKPAFRRGETFVTFGALRAMAARAALPGSDGPLFLHVTSAAHLTAGLLAAAAERRAVALPAHAQPAYLAEIGATGALVADAAFGGEGEVRALSEATEDPLLCFFTSGSTGAPKRVEKNLSRLERESAALDRIWGNEAGHVVATVSHQHIYGLLYRIVWPLLTGRTSDDEAAEYWEALEGRLGSATLISSPAHLVRLSPRADLYADAPGLVFSSGQFLPWEAAQACTTAFGGRRSKCWGQRKPAA